MTGKYQDSRERRFLSDRRTPCDRRGQYANQLFSCSPGWDEQRVQYGSRYFLLTIAFIYLNYFKSFSWQDSSFWVMNGTLLAYAILNTFNLLHARLHPISERRFMLAMWADIAAITMVVTVDPLIMPPTLFMFLMVALGNGMRYGMKIFAQAVAGCIGGSVIALFLRLSDTGIATQPGTIITVMFLSVFLMYAYFLMTRIDHQQNRIMVNSRTDSLTGMLNRGSIYEAAENMFRNAVKTNERISLLFADLDKFKAVNDTHGHAAGDMVLAAVSDIIKRSLRQSDLAGRYGGDEFVILMPGMKGEDAEKVATRIRENVVNWSTGNRIELDISIGVSEAPQHGYSLDALLQHADRALYSSKHENLQGSVRRAADLELPEDLKQKKSVGQVHLH